MNIQDRVKELENWNTEILRLLDNRKKSIKALENKIKELEKKISSLWTIVGYKS